VLRTIFCTSVSVDQGIDINIGWASEPFNLADGRLALMEALRPMSWCRSSCPRSMFVWGIVSERNLHISNVRMMPMTGVYRSEVCLEQGGRSVSP
jgi:hypothetical protein